MLHIFFLRIERNRNEQEHEGHTYVHRDARLPAPNHLCRSRVGRTVRGTQHQSRIGVRVEGGARGRCSLETGERGEGRGFTVAREQIS
jgi:hypothetical protein